jgi:hypothetical protein
VQYAPIVAFACSDEPAVVAAAAAGGDPAAGRVWAWVVEINARRAPRSNGLFMVKAFPMFKITYRLEEYGRIDRKSINFFGLKSLGYVRAGPLPGHKKNGFSVPGNAEASARGFDGLFAQLFKLPPKVYRFHLIPRLLTRLSSGKKIFPSRFWKFFDVALPLRRAPTRC